MAGLFVHDYARTGISGCKSISLMKSCAMPKSRLEEFYASYVAGIFRTLRFGTGEAHGRAQMMEFSYLGEQHALGYAGGRYAIDFTRMPAALTALAKELLEMEATGDRGRAEAWFAKYDRMPQELKTALAAAPTRRHQGKPCRGPGNGLASLRNL